MQCLSDVFETVLMLMVTWQGCREGGQVGTKTPGPMDFRGPIKGPMGFRKAVGFSGLSRGLMSSRRGPSK